MTVELTRDLEERNLGESVSTSLRTIRAHVLGDKDPGGGDLSLDPVQHHVAAQHLYLWGQYDAAQSILEGLTGEHRAPETRRGGHLDLAGMHAARGQIERARKHEAAAPQSLESSWTGKAWLATLPFLPESSARQDQWLRLIDEYEALEWSDIDEGTVGYVNHIYRYGLLHALVGQPAIALRHAAVLRSHVPESWNDWGWPLGGDVLEAVVLIRRNERSRALSFLEGAAEAGNLVPQSRLMLADLLTEHGRHQEAAAWYGTLDGLDARVLEAPAHLGRARALNALGRATEAADAYERFIELWEEADRELQPQVDAARAELAALR